MPLDQFAGELIGEFPGLDILVARNHVQKAWADICDEGLWSWLVAADVPLAAPVVVSAGLVTVTQGSLLVVGDAAASAAWLPLALANPPISSPTLGQGRQFRIGSVGPIYNIVGYDGVSTLTLDRPFAEVSASNQQYQIYRCYFATPSADFLRYMTITNLPSAYSITGRSLTLNQEQLNRMDPQRGDQGNAYRLASYKVAANGTPVHELWPAPTNGNAYVAVIQRRGGAANPLTATGVTPAVDIPLTLNPSLVITRAKYWSADWAVKNVNRHPDLKGVNWYQIRAGEQKQYEQEMIKARRQDFEIFKNTWIAPKGRFVGFPIDAAFIQSHDVDMLFSGTE